MATPGASAHPKTLKSCFFMASQVVSPNCNRTDDRWSCSWRWHETFQLKSLWHDMFKINLHWFPRHETQSWPTLQSCKSNKFNAQERGNVNNHHRHIVGEKNNKKKRSPKSGLQESINHSNLRKNFCQILIEKSDHSFSPGEPQSARQARKEH